MDGEMADIYWTYHMKRCFVMILILGFIGCYICAIQAVHIPTSREAVNYTPPLPAVVGGIPVRNENFFVFDLTDPVLTEIESIIMNISLMWMTMRFIDLFIMFNARDKETAFGFFLERLERQINQ